MGFRKPTFAGELLARRKGPVVRKKVDQLRHDRTFEPEVRVDHRMDRVIARDVLSTDIQASREGDAAVHA